MADNISVSGTTSPYTTQTYSAQSNDKNTLSIESYFKLLATQLANQDMTSPMDNSEMMAQLTQMAMIQSITTMTETMQNSANLSTQTYAAGLVGQEVTVAVTEENGYGIETAVDVKYGNVESVSLVGGNATFRLEGDDKDYPLSYLVGIGRIPNPYKSDEEDDGKGDQGENDQGENETLNTAFI